ncbi:ArgS-related anticodon-binding protein NrtL [Streptomyces sp. NPDC127092]|uniref:ArgS-related anticodon-binding protein NrtL n=1 Tax=Streptomyces sp. NPDC127092 TaxID=3347135 RepID=UPI00365067CC
MTPADLSLTVLHAVRRAVDEGVLRVDVPARVAVERSRAGGTGDYATSVALRLARPSGLDARDVAEILKERLSDSPAIRSVDITGPGFLNFTLDGSSQELVHDRVIREIARTGISYGHSQLLSGTHVRFAPVTEPRAVLLTETVIRLLQAQGATGDIDGIDGIDGADRTDDSSVISGTDRSVGEPSATADVGTHTTDVDTHTTTPHPERLPVAPSVYLPDLLGVDVARWALLRPAAHDRVLDGAALLVQHERNPLFRVRYAHARARRLVDNAAQLGFAPAYESAVDEPRLLGLLGDHPAVLLSAARHRAPDRVARHLEAVADAFLAFQHTVLPLGDEKPSAAHRSRLALAEAAGTVLAGGLSLLGISAPDQI